MRSDPLRNLDGLRVGVRVSLRVVSTDGAADRLGLVLDLDDSTITVEDRAGRVHVIPRQDVRIAKRVPTVARGRNPLHADPTQLRSLAQDATLTAPDPTVTAPDEVRYWVARLCDIVDHLDDSGVTPPPGQADTATHAARGASRGLVNGEWAAFQLADADALTPLAAWAARRNARNVVLTSALPDNVLDDLKLIRLTG